MPTPTQPLTANTLTTPIKASVILAMLISLIFTYRSAHALPSSPSCNSFLGKISITKKNEACLPSKKSSSGFENGVLCNHIYFCALQSAYDTFIAPESAPITQTIKPPPTHEIMATLSSTLNQRGNPVFSCKNNNCQTRALTWVVPYPSLRQKICQLPLPKHRANPDLSKLGLRLRQWLGMPPLAYKSSNPYQKMGLYLIQTHHLTTISHWPGLLAYNSQHGENRDLLIKIKHPVTKQTPILQLCQNTNDINYNNCHNHSSAKKSAYQIWAQTWPQHVYPLIFFSKTNKLPFSCLRSSPQKNMSCLQANQFFPWIGIGYTYNWQPKSIKDKNYRIKSGLREYGFAKNTTFSAQDIHFIPLTRIYAELCLQKK